MDETKQIAVVKRIILGTIIMEYALRELQPETLQQLRQRVNQAIQAANRVQDYFIHHPQSKPSHRADFKEEFLNNNLVLIGEAAEVLWAFPEEELENIVKQLKEALIPAELTN